MWFIQYIQYYNSVEKREGKTNTIYRKTHNYKEVTIELIRIMWDKLEYINIYNRENMITSIIMWFSKVERGIL